MSDIKGTGGELRATVHVTRADGKVETYELVGAVSPEQAAALAADGIHPQPRQPVHHGSSGAVVGPAAKLSND